MPLVCSGSLLNDQWILTSASCVCNTKNTYDLVVRSGKVHTCSVSEINETEYAIEGFYCYSDFNPTVLASDLALIKLNITHATKNIRPVCLKHGRKRQQIKSDDLMVYFGWGNIASMTPDHAILNKSISTIVKKRKCRSSFLKEGITKVENSIFCTMANISDACTGNPGSGVVAVDGNKHLSLQGVISKSTNKCGQSESFIANSKVQSKGIQNWIRKTFSL